MLSPQVLTEPPCDGVPTPSCKPGQCCSHVPSSQAFRVSTSVLGLGLHVSLKVAQKGVHSSARTLSIAAMLTDSFFYGVLAAQIHQLASLLQ